jgi:hypothetical protein
MRVRSLIPYRDTDCVWRRDALGYCSDWLAQVGVGGPVLGRDDRDLPFSRTAAILDGVDRDPEVDVWVIPDGDVFLANPAALAPAIEAALVHGWAVPHRLLHRLAPGSTRLVIHGAADWSGLPLDQTSRRSGAPDQSRRDWYPYEGLAAGTFVVVSAEALRACPPDPRFRGWGHEEQAWSAALRTLVGPGWRGDADCVHLWHPPQPRVSRRRGSRANVELQGRYDAAAAEGPEAVSAIIDEWRTR